MPGDRRHKDDNVKARQWLEKAITLDPKYAEGYAGPGSFIRTPMDQDIFGNIDNSSTLFETLLSGHLGSSPVIQACEQKF